METARNHWRQPRWEVTHPGCLRGWNSWAEHHPLGWTHTWEGRVHDGCHPGDRGGILNGGRRDHPWAGRTLLGSCRDPRREVEHFPGVAPAGSGTLQDVATTGIGTIPRNCSGSADAVPPEGCTRGGASPPMDHSLQGGVHLAWRDLLPDGVQPGGALLPRRSAAPTRPGSGVPTRMGATHPTGRRIAGGGELASVSEAADRSGKGYRLDGAGVGLLKYGSIRRFEIALA